PVFLGDDRPQEVAQVFADGGPAVTRQRPGHGDQIPIDPDGRSLPGRLPRPACLLRHTYVQCGGCDHSTVSIGLIVASLPRLANSNQCYTSAVRRSRTNCDTNKIVETLLTCNRKSLRYSCRVERFDSQNEKAPTEPATPPRPRPA